jgi:hypothetical protein
MPVFSEDIAEQFSKGVYANNASFYSQLDSSNFKDGQSFAVANLDNSIAEYVISNLHHNVAAVFSSRCGTLRSVYYDNIITAFQKMSPDPQKHVALCFGAGSILQSKLKTVNNGDNVYEYNGFEIYNLPGSPALEPFIVFISKSLVPKITIINPKEEIKNKYKLERITEKYNIYLGIVDLKKDSDLKRWLLRDNKMTKEQLKDKCFVTTYFYYYLYIPVGCILGGFKLVDSFSGVANEIKYLGALPRS